MCLGNAIKTGFKGNANFLDIIKKLDPTFAKNFDAKKAANAKKTSVASPTPAIKKTLPKQKRRLRSFSKLGYNPGRRSFLEGGQ